MVGHWPFVSVETALAARALSWVIVDGATPIPSFPWVPCGHAPGLKNLPALWFVFLRRYILHVLPPVDKILLFRKVIVPTLPALVPTPRSLALTAAFAVMPKPWRNRETSLLTLFLELRILDFSITLHLDPASPDTNISAPLLITYRPLGAVDREFLYRELGGGGFVLLFWYLLGNTY